MKLFIYYLKRNICWISILLLNLFVMSIIMELVKIPHHEWVYGVIISVFFLFVIGTVDFLRYYARHKKLVEAKKVICISVDALEMPGDQIEEDYQKLLKMVYRDKVKAVDDLENQRKNLSEYYTMWVHQIKTPIAALRLLLRSEDTPRNREAAEELFRIEQYVEMALHYSRLDSNTTDFRIQKCSLDHIVREAVRKYAGLFVRKKIQLEYGPLDVQVLTDEKWLEFVIEQIISNAIKYTPKGKIFIYMEGESTLVIEDTGIGIFEEDLPRICEKGYTGYNGHNDKSSTGIGLYLCERILKNLSHTITVESEPEKGTRVKIGMITEDRFHE